MDFYGPHKSPDQIVKGFGTLISLVDALVEV